MAVHRSAPTTISTPCKGDMFFSQLVGPTLGRVAILDARGRSPYVRSSRPPIVGPRGRGSLPRLPAVNDGVGQSRLLPPEILESVPVALIWPRLPATAGRHP